MPKKRFAVPQGFTVTAHSGCMGQPENTIQSMQAGVDVGAQIVEFDLRFTDTGEPVLSHDAPEGQCVPLRDAFAFLRRYPAVRANVDLKDTSHLEKVLPSAQETGVLPQIFFTGVETRHVPAVREKCPGVPYYLNLKIGRKDDADALADKAAALGAVGINVRWNSLRPQVVRACRARGLLVSVWTVDTVWRSRRMLRMQPDNITSRRPDRVLSLVKGAQP